MLPEGGENILDLDFRQWLAARRVRLYENAEDAFAGALSQGAARLPFVKRARVELQTSLGGRKGAGGVDVAGALRETDDDIVGWQLRGYAAEHGSKGLNTGLFYRRVVGGALAGVNVFADYEDGDDGDFWRWSVGGDVKNRFGELSANHYFAITDAQVIDGKNAYTREGYDVDFAVRIPRLEWAKARVGYYEFKGEFGDEDENGFRAGLDLSPGAGLVLGVEYDDDDGKFGGNISYTHHFGETQRGAQRAGEFEPRAHFYDAVAREYSQRISRAEGGGGGLVIVGAGVNVEVKNETTTVTLTAGAEAVNAAFPLAGSITVTSAGSGSVTMRGGAWHLTLSGANAALAFRGGTVMNVFGGMGSFERNGGNIGEVIMAGAVITLLGTRFDFQVRADNSVFITLHEGGLGIAAVNNVSVVAAQRASVVIGGVAVRCGGAETRDGASANCGFGMTAAAADVVTAITAPAGGDVVVGRYVLAQRADEITASVSGAGFFLMTSQMSVVNVLISQAAAAVPDVNVKRATLHLTDAAGLLSPTVSAAVFVARVNSPDAGFGMAVSGADVMTAITAPAAGDVVVGRYVLAQRAGDISASVSGGGFFVMTNQMATLNVLISQAAAATPDVNVKRVTLHLTDTANLLLPPVSAAVFAARVNPRAITLRFTGMPVASTLTTAGDITVGTLEVVNGYNAQDISFTGARGDFRLDAGDSANQRLLILGGDNTQARTVSVVLRGDDNDATTLPFMISVGVSIIAIPPFIVPPAEITVTTASTPPSGPAVTITPQGGTPPYRYLLFNPPREISTPLPLPPNAYIRWSGGGGILSFYGAQMRAAPGMEAQVRIIVEDSSTPRRRISVITTMHFVLPPPVTLSITQTVNSTPAGASSLAVASLAYSGGSTGGALTATVVGVKDGFGSVSDNEVLMSASAAGEVIATINAYDSANSTAPNATAFITVNFTGGG